MRNSLIYFYVLFYYVNFVSLKPQITLCYGSEIYLNSLLEISNRMKASMSIEYFYKSYKFMAF